MIGSAATAAHPALSDVPDEVGFLGPWVSAGIFVPAEVHLAAWGARTFPAATERELLALALAARGPRLGHVCVLPAEAATTVGSDEGAGGGVPEWPEPTAWLVQLGASDLVATAAEAQAQLEAGEHGEPADPVKPLVLDGERLYLHRYWIHELSIARAVGRRATTPPRELPGLVEALDRAFGAGTPGAPPDLQRQAATRALTLPLAIVAGGPGTGKTRTIARLLVAAAEVGGLGPDGVALAAPTGKASKRMKEALGRALADLSGPPDGEGVEGEPVAGLGELEPRTVHKLLGWMPGGNHRHGAGNPLPHRLVVVDEASMLAAGQMARLLEAVADDATLVLVGDPAQLASVEAGAVFGDLVAAATSGGDAPLASCTTVLREVHRFAADSGIAALAAAIRDGDGDRSVDVLRAGLPDVRWVEPDDPSDGARAARDDVLAEVVGRCVEMVEHARRGDSPAALAAATGSKVLCATRRGPNGLRDWSDRIERSVDARLRLGRGAPWYVGRPVLVTRNDPVSKVVNGDVGVVVAAGPADVPATPVMIDRGDGDGARAVAPGRLADVETWWAMTIHKSQGSEFADVVVALPTVESPIVSRELLYTGVTRARERVTVVASEESVRRAVQRPVARASGLRGRLA